VKNLKRVLSLLVVLSMMMCMSVMAGEIESITEKAAGVTAEPLTGNVAFELQYSEVTDGGMYLILVLSEDGVPTADNILYVNQGTAGDGKVAFDNVYPKEIPETASFVYMSGTDMAYSKLAKVNPKVAAVTGMKGDVNLDGTVNMTDAVRLLRHTLGIEKLTDPVALANGEVMGDEILDMKDCVKILRYYLGIISTLD
jgi:hypothetical protein